VAHPIGNAISATQVDVSPNHNMTKKMRPSLTSSVLKRLKACRGIVFDMDGTLTGVKSSRLPVFEVVCINKKVLRVPKLYKLGPSFEIGQNIGPSATHRFATNSCYAAKVAGQSV
jgi:hypothetical protein